jgi:hypothetical protein
VARWRDIYLPPLGALFGKFRKYNRLLWVILLMFLPTRLYKKGISSHSTSRLVIFHSSSFVRRHIVLVLYLVLLMMLLMLILKWKIEKNEVSQMAKSSATDWGNIELVFTSNKQQKMRKSL